MQTVKCRSYCPDSARRQDAADPRAVGTGWSLELVLPTSGPFAGPRSDVVWPDLSDPLADYESALADAIDSPVGAARLEEQVAAGLDGGNRGR